MKRLLGMVLVFSLAALVFAVSWDMATAVEESPCQQAELPDVIVMQADYPHTKTLVRFSHRKHVTDDRLNCGACHHDDAGEPRMDLKVGDPVDQCIDCHPEPGEGPRGSKLSKAERLEYHAEALHDNCRGCHKQHKKEGGSGAAPTACSKCHLRE
jgi:hypothetical protein